MKRSYLKPEFWPEADRALWQALVASGGLLESSGPGARWRPATQMIFKRDYGFWLQYLQTIGIDLAAEPPVGRVSAGRVNSYILSLGDLAASTRAGRIRALSILMSRAQPTGEWQWLLAMRRPLAAAERLERGVRKRQRIVAAHRLYESGVHHLETTRGRRDLSPLARSVKFRDGLIVALLAARPLRLKNFAGLRLGYHFQGTPSEYRIEIPAEESKTGRPIETFVPEELLAPLAEYLRTHRPILLRGAEDDHLWITRQRGPFAPENLSSRICHLTQKLVGSRVNPHLFRDCAATTIATVDPEHVRIVAPLLGHTAAVTAELYYNQARTIEAGRAHQANIRQIRERTRPIRRRRVPFCERP
jgi:integrase/recombinase XerD